MDAVPEIIAVIGQERHRAERIAAADRFIVRFQRVDAVGVTDGGRGHDRDLVPCRQRADRLGIAIAAGQRFVDEDRLAELRQNLELLQMLCAVHAFQQERIHIGHGLDRIDDFQARRLHVFRILADAVVAVRKRLAPARKRLHDPRTRHVKFIVALVQQSDERRTMRCIQPDHTDFQRTHVR